MTGLFAIAAAQWRAMRAEYEVIRESHYRQALDATNGVLLNARGLRAGVDPYSLFMGTEARANAYASEELIEHWRYRPRLTLAAFERQMLDEWQEAS